MKDERNKFRRKGFEAGGEEYERGLVVNFEGTGT